MFPRQLLLLTLYAMLAFAPIDYARAQWVQTNGPNAGSIYCLATNGTTLFAGSESNVFSSADNGGHWVSISNGLPTSSVYSLASTGNTIFAGFYIFGLYRSTDNGASWAGTINGTIYSLTTIGTDIFAGTDGGLFRSTDNGTTWTKVMSGIINIVTALGTTLFEVGHTSIQRSIDNGASWSVVGSGLPSPGFSYVNSLTVRGSDLFAGTGSGVYRSSDSGSTWVAASINMTINALIINGANFIAGTLNGISRSTDNGQSWVQPTKGVPVSYNIEAFAMIGTNIFAATKGAGVYRTTDNGNTWIPVNTNLANTLVYSLATNGQYLFAGTAGSGFFRTSDKGNTWTDPVSNESFFGDMNSIFSLAVIGNYLFAGIHLGVDFSTGHGIYRSNDNGTSWTEMSNGISGTTILCLTSKGSEILAGTAGLNAPGLFRSIDNGATWGNIFAVSQSSAVQSVVAVGNNLFAGTFEEGISTSQDGFNWYSSNTGLPVNSSVNDLTTIGSTLFAATQSDGVYRSTNNGGLWTAVNTGAPPYDGVYCFASSGSDLFIGSGAGVFCSTDNGVSWKAAGLKNMYVHSLAVIGSDLFAGIVPGAVWRRAISEFSDVEISPVSKAELRNYPNPFSGSTSISFTPEASGYAEVTIINPLGVEVAHLFSGEVGMDRQHFTWDAKGLPDGMYECIVRMNGRVEKLPVLLLR